VLRCAEQMAALEGIAAHINPTAHVLTAAWGKVPLDVVVGGPKGRKSWVQCDDEDDLRNAINAAKQQVGKRTHSVVVEHIYSAMTRMICAMLSMSAMTRMICAMLSMLPSSR
jgi:hypothetical protein